MKRYRARLATLLHKLLLAALCLFSFCATGLHAQVGLKAPNIQHVSVSGPTLTLGTPRGNTGKNVERTHEGVLCRVRYNWPSALSRGYFPVSVALKNTTATTLAVEVWAELAWSQEDLVRRDVLLAPSESVEFEMMLRARELGINDYKVWIEILGEKMPFNCGPSHSVERNIMLVSAQPFPAGAQDDLTALWTKLDPGIAWGSGAKSTAVSTLVFDQLSTNWQAYTSLDAVVLDLSSGIPPEPILAALASWCRSGGTLALLGVPVSELRANPALAGNLEERFEIDPEGHLHRSIRTEGTASEAVESARLVGYRFGFGSLVCQRSLPNDLGMIDPGPDPSGMPLAYVASSVPYHESWTRGERGGRTVQRNLETDFKNFTELPLKSLMVFMLLFTLVMGPVNFIWVWRKKKPMLLLVSVPCIALVSSLGLLAYGIFAQGLDTRATSHTWSVLNQGTQVGTCNEMRRVFAGMAPSEGLRPQAGTVVYPSEMSWQGSWSGDKLFVADYTDGLVLSGDFFPVRQPFTQMIMSDRTSRLRVAVKSVGEEVEISNALGAPIQRLLLRGFDGQYHVLSDALGEGQSSRLVLAGAKAQLSDWSRDLGRYWGSSARELIPGSYIAALSDAPLQDDCGVSIDIPTGRHVLLGILESTEL